MFDKTQEIPIGSDHGGFELKGFIRDKLQEDGYHLKDFGSYSEDRVDYPDFVHPVAKMVNDGKAKFGIIICGSGQGASMTANKYPNVRAGLCWDMVQARLTRLHNNANIISLPGRFIDFDLGLDMVKTFLHTEFEGGRHIQRVNKISTIL